MPPSRRPVRPTPTRRARAPRGAAVLVVVGVVTAAACSGGNDPFALRASFETSLDTLVVYPLSGTELLLPSGVDLFSGAAVRPGLRGGAYPNFDFAVDRNAQGQVVLYPAQRVAVAPAGSPRVGFSLQTVAFDALVTAPRDGYRFDSTQVVTIGQTVAIESQGVSTQGLVCGSSNSPMRAKLVVDSVARTTGAIHLRVRTNPNCGFRSLAPGLPKD
jgi:hypothetical protein